MTINTQNKRYLNYVNGEWIESSKNEWTENRNPANTEEVVGYVPKSSNEDLDKAVAAAKNSQKEWKKLSGDVRGKYLYKAADILDSRIDEVAESMTREMGKTLPEAKGETARGVAILRYYAGEGLRKVGDVIPSTDKEALMFTTRAPLGVVGIITPWNFPVAIPIWKAAPALIYGNSIVLKPATEAAVTCAKVFECFELAGFPSGVVNMVTGPGNVIGKGIANHSDVNGITFTGSNTVGKQIGQTALARGAKYQLEMGGKNPVIVDADADLDQAVEATISGAFRSTGQKCTATSRVIVLENVYDRFKEKLVAKTNEIIVGDGLQEGVWMGPAVNERQLNTVLSYIQKGRKEGASLVIGGERLTAGSFEKGHFIQPTIFENVTTSMTIAQEEIFGPVITLMKVNTMEEALNIANDVEFGLSASIFTSNIQKMLTFIEDIDAGLVRINAESAGVELQAPFGGMKNSSSHSREQGQAAIEFFTSIKTVLTK
ncbi:aldehyde dehydrogenase [Virgibacillus sp. CM-4]|uniref:alpha-ketoglutaric semialdehyde dehydrogenase GucD n=1 Tax=Virgibacillus sp. CM-4 TaxID=1354277 RepID=UPI0003885936|nr:alpha-ketoglutaric semialdehyde dehydrogenase GucD [Virgibacillus sp. CM-4]EQB37118.1 aldehyde dehydrogenase [Virgibacillus sp. CM-4]